MRCAKFFLMNGLLLGFAFALPAGPAAAQSRGDNAVAIVIHPAARVDGLSFAELRRIFMGEQQFWPDKTRITLLMRAPAAPERKVVLDRIYQMSEGQFRQYWIAKIFRAEVASGPKIVYSSEMARELVSALPGAIAFVRAADVSPEMKVLRVDGRLPGDSGYPLR